MKLTLPYPPSANEYWKPAIVKRKPRMVPTTLAVVYKAAIFNLLEPHLKGVKFEDGHEVTFIVNVFRPRNSGDTGNRHKVLEDAFNQLVWSDDRQVARLEMERWPSDDKLGRVDVEIVTHVPRPPPARPEMPPDFMRRLAVATAQVEQARAHRRAHLKAKAAAREERKVKGLRKLASPSIYRRRWS